MFDEPRNHGRDERGFTLIELLVVVLIIGILAAIALPAFLSQRGKAQDTEAKSQVRAMQVAQETLYTDEKSYVLGNLAKLQAIEPSLSSGKATPAVSASAANTYTVTSTSATGNVFTIAKGSVVNRTCTQAGTYGCPIDGSW